MEKELERGSDSVKHRQNKEKKKTNKQKLSRQCGASAMACNNNLRMHRTVHHRLNDAVSAQNENSYCNMSSSCSKINQHRNSNRNRDNISRKYVTNKRNSNQLISSNQCQKPMLNTVLRLTHNCRYVNAAAILLITLNILVTLSPCDAFLLDGSQNSFAQFRKWYTGLNGSLEFEFKTEQPNGLVLYTDDGGTFDFFEIKLVEGAVRLRYNLGGGANIITVGRELHDGHWHKVQVSQALFVWK